MKLTSPRDCSTVFIGDVHGDAAALRHSIYHSGRAERTHGGPRLLSRTHLIPLGDLFDRGRDNLGVADQVCDLMNQADSNREVSVDLVRGNHDTMMEHCLKNPHYDDLIDSWLRRNEGYRMLQEIAKKYRLTLSRPVYDTFPATGSVQSPEEAQQTREDWQQFAKRKRLGRYDFPEAFRKAQELFLDGGRYERIFRKMQLTVNACGRRVLGVHAGITDRVLEHGILQSTIDCEYMSVGKNLRRAVYKSRHPVYEALWMRREEQRCGRPLTCEGVDKFRDANYLVAVHGHNLRINGIPELSVCRSIRGRIAAVINIDTAMSKGYSYVKNRWGYVLITPEGRIIAESQASGGKLDFGCIKERRYYRPKK